MIDAEPEWWKLRDHLLETGAMSPDWVRAYDAVPRALFLPDVMWPSVEGQDIAVSREDDPARWHHWAARNVAITTQWDDGRHTGVARGELPTSSSSMPGMVFSMFADLSVADGMRVLEIGTGTGWCAALLSARLGEDNVVSVEVDETVADRARKALHTAGWHPEVITGDGLLGWPHRAPYDRILVTASVREIPRAWIDQARPGAVLVMPWGTRYTPQDAIVRLVVADDGSASGRFTRPARFMQVRSERLGWPTQSDYILGDSWPADTRESATVLIAAEVLPDSDFAAVDFVIGLLVPDCVHTSGRDPYGRLTMWLFGLADRSWAAVFFDEDDPTDSRVFQGGPRNLWAEVEAAHHWWAERGRPGHEEFGLTITADGHQQPWLGEPYTNAEVRPILDSTPTFGHDVLPAETRSTSTVPTA
ncbi:methyltransferase domain-containing protein [Streptosporangium saharense]|uniref:methyltransferase domain-containing protein n=1 Tax=Streptosporangium saharense TaxID=1706840 RepID=UPI0036AA153F